MSVDADTVRRISRLARIRLEEGEVQALVPELNNILHWVEQLGEVDTAGVEPLARVVPIEARLREDRVTDGDQVAKVLANAPDATQGFFAVPRVVE